MSSTSSRRPASPSQRSRRASADRRAASDRLALVIEAQHAIATAGLDLDTVLSLVLDRATRLTDADAAAVVLLADDDRDTLLYRAASGRAAALLGFPLPVGASLSGECVRAGEARRSDDAERDPRVNLEACRRVVARSVLAVPLRHGSDIVGVLEVSSPEPAAFDDEDAGALELIAGLIAACLHNAGELAASRAEAAERADALAVLHESEERFRSAFEHAGIGMALVGLDGRWLRVNCALCRILGYSLEELASMHFQDVTHPDDLESSRVQAERLIAGEIPFHEAEKRYVHKSGRLVPCLLTASLVRDAAGRPLHFVTQIQDVSERKAAEAALRRSEARLAEAQRVARVGSWEVDLATGQALWSAELRRLVGLEPGEAPVPIEAFYALVHRDDRERVRRELEARVQSAQSGQPYEFQFRIVRTDGEVRVHRGAARLVLDERGVPVRLVGTAQDVTEQVAAETALREREELFRALIEHAPDVVGILAPDGTIRYESPSIERVLGYRPDEMLGCPVLAFVHPDDAAGAAARLAATLGTPGTTCASTYRCRHKDGSWRTLEAHVWNLVDHPAVRGVVINARDVTERERAELALRESNARLHLALSATNMVAWERDLDSGEIAGDDYAAGIGSFAQFLEWVHPEDRARVVEANERAIAERSALQVDFRVTAPDGSVRWRHTRGSVLTNADGVPTRMVGVALDVTDRVQLEAQLRQSQKMEAVGRLAGGVAHDFNNLLMVIQGHTRFAMDVARDEAVHEDLRAVEAAAERAAGLTRQLLTFSRKQLLQPRAIDLNAVVRGLEPMLRRLIGEDITVVTRLAPTLGAVRGDPAQLEQVLINLAVNARDAMPEGGSLVIETADVELGSAHCAVREAPITPGRYVRLTVRDTGAGMDEVTRARAFEPFFTTKAPGKGTGLGLASVYGIVRQSGGSVRITSAPGAGTTVEVELPRMTCADHDVDAAARTPTSQAGSETVLVVEDEPAVREIVRRVLARGGYTLLEASNGREALEVLARHTGRVDLVLSDVVMPEMGGRALAERLGAMRPGARVLFMSGYTDDEILRRGLRAASAAMLEKPFTAEALLDAVRAALDGAPVRPA